jgi:hypothetical protein
VAQTPISRVGAARRRASYAKLAFVGGGVLAFGASAVLARVAYPGHSKRHVRSLSPPQRFVRTVRENQLETGMLAPAQAAPEATSAPT